MKNLNDLYHYATKNNINIKNFNMCNENLKGLCLYNNRICNVYIDKNINSIDEKCTLAEEIGHYKKGIAKSNFYDIREQDLIIRSINEFRAKKWAVNELIPFKEFKRFLGSNLTKFEVANELGVTEELLEMASFIYEPLLYD